MYDFTFNDLKQEIISTIILFFIVEVQWLPENNECYTKFITKLRGHPIKNLVVRRILANKSAKVPIISFTFTVNYMNKYT